MASRTRLVKLVSRGFNQVSFTLQIMCHWYGVWKPSAISATLL